MGWAAILKGTGKAVNATGKSAGSALIHPAQTVRGVGTAIKSVTTGAATGYVGWQYLVNDKSVAETVSDVAIGEKNTERLSNAIDGVVSVTEKASDAVDKVNGTTDTVSSALDGVIDFFKNIFSGKGGDMMGNFFSNIGKGNVSGMSMIGLVAAAFLSFGRFGWMSKIAGLLLGALLIGNNSRTQERSASTGGVSQGERQEKKEEEEQHKGMRR